MTGGAPPDPLGRFAPKVAAARLILLAEALARGLWPLAAVIGLLLALAWTGLFERISPLLHLVIVGLFALGGLAALWPLRRLRLPTVAEAARRMEQAGALGHRPLATLGDRLDPGADPLARRLWAAHQAAVLKAAASAPLPRPAPSLANHDRYALRCAVVLLMAIGAFAAGPHLGERSLTLFDLSRPLIAGPAAAGGPTYTAWIAPPAYTGKAPIYLGPEGVKPGERLMVPKGAKVVAQISHVESGAIGFDEQTINLAPVDNGNVAGEAVINSGERLTLLDGRSEIAGWPLTVVPDAPPTAFFIGLPETTSHQALKISYRAADDYGLTQVALRLTLTEPGAEPRPPRLIPLQSGSGQTSLKGSVFKDLTADNWAGLAVKAEIVATDSAGQTGASPPLALTLPERKFNNPVARAIIAERRRLIAHPADRRAVIERLAEIASDTDSYDNRTAVYLGFSFAIGRIARHAGQAMAEEVGDLLWAMALDLEEGQVASSREALRAAQDALQDALRNGASDAEIDRLMAELRQAMNDYLKAMTEEAARHGGTAPGLRSPDQRMISSDVLRQMLDQAQRMAQGGSREQAAEMLSRLRQTLENLQSMQSRAQPGSAADSMGKALDQLQGMIGRQRDLRDQSFSAAQGQGDQGEGDQFDPNSGLPPGLMSPFGTGQQRPGNGSRPGNSGQGPGQNQGQGPNQGMMGQQSRPGQGMPGQGMPGQGMAGQGNPGRGGSLGDQARQQEALRRSLGDLMRQLSDAGVDPSGPLGQAERSMNEARQALDNGDPSGAADAQGQALGALREGMRSLGQSLAQELGMQPGNGQEPGQPDGMAGDAQIDPLGRPRPGQSFGTGDDTHIPTSFEVKGVRAILDELRKRAGERDRPQEERDYIERLLKRF